MRSLFADIKDSMQQPEFWALSSWLDIVVKYRQSRLGLLWLLAPSIIYVWGMGGMFANMQSISALKFYAYVALGYNVFRFVSAVMIESATAFTGSSSFILDGHVRLTDFVMRVIAKAIFYFVVATPVIAVALAVSPEFQWSGLLVAALSVPLVLLNAIWIGVVFAMVGARFPDFGQFVSNIFIFAFLLTPIIWRADTMPAGGVRGMIVRFNPLYHMIEVIRAPILGQPLPVHSLAYLVLLGLIGWLVASVLYRRYAPFVPLWV